MDRAIKDLKDFPADVRQSMGHVLFYAQEGKLHEHIKILKGMGSAGVQEIRENHRSGTYRVVYTVEMDAFIFVLHAFQKKIKIGYCYTKTRNRITEQPFKRS